MDYVEYSQKTAQEPDYAAARECLMDLYHYFRMDSNTDPLILFDQLCCIFLKLWGIPESSDIYTEIRHAKEPMDWIRLYEDFIDGYNNYHLGGNVSSRNEFLDHPELIQQLFDAVLNVMAHLNYSGKLFKPLLLDFFQTIATARQNGALSTPMPTAREIVELLYQNRQTKLVLDVLDPFCGSGAFLIAVLEKAAAEQTMTQLRLVGLERDMNLRNSLAILSEFYCGYNSPLQIKDGGTGPNIPRQSYDLILANPPFRSQSLRKRETLDDNAPLPIPTKDAHRAFVQRTLLGLRPGGESAIIVPDNFLTSIQGEAIRIRRWILEEYQCLAVVKLPYHTFYPQAAVHSSVLFLRNPAHPERPDPASERVFFFQVQQDGRSDDTRRQPVPQNDFWELRRVWGELDPLWREWRGAPQTQNMHGIDVPVKWEHPLFWFGRMKDVSQNDFSLLPERYQPLQLLTEGAEDPRLLLAEMEELGREIMGLTARLMEADNGR